MRRRASYRWLPVKLCSATLSEVFTKPAPPPQFLKNPTAIGVGLAEGLNQFII